MSTASVASSVAAAGAAIGHTSTATNTSTTAATTAVATTTTPLAGSPHVLMPDGAVSPSALSSGSISSDGGGGGGPLSDPTAKVAVGSSEEVKRSDDSNVTYSEPHEVRVYTGAASSTPGVLSGDDFKNKKDRSHHEVDIPASPVSEHESSIESRAVYNDIKEVNELQLGLLLSLHGLPGIPMVAITGVVVAGAMIINTAFRSEHLDWYVPTLLLLANACVACSLWGTCVGLERGLYARRLEVLRGHKLAKSELLIHRPIGCYILAFGFALVFLMIITSVMEPYVSLRELNAWQIICHICVLWTICIIRNRQQCEALISQKELMGTHWVDRLLHHHACCCCCCSPFRRMWRFLA